MAASFKGIDTVCFVEYLIFLPIIEISTALCFIYFTCLFIKSKESVPDKWLYYLGIIAFLFQILYVIFAATARMYAAITTNCSHSNIDLIHASLSAVAITGVSMQYLILLLIMFIRLKHLFHSTPFQISYFTIFTFVILFILTFLLAIAYAAVYFIFYDDSESAQVLLLSGLIFGSFFLLIIALSIMLNVLFVFKLIKVNREIYKKQSDAQRLVATITKISILSFLCVASTLFVTAMGVITQGLVINTIHGWFAHAIAVVFDVCTNFVCIYLSFHSSNTHYMKVCGFCDGKCKKLCQKVAGGDEMELVKQMSVPTTTKFNTETTP